MTHVLVARLDSAGDVLLAGPALRAVAAGADRVTLWCGPQGQDCAALLPGVDEVLSAGVEWVAAEPGPVDRDRVDDLVDRLAAVGADQAIVLTSFHQSALPTALLLRMAGVGTVAAVSDDYPGSLLDVRHRLPEDGHEVERALSLVATLGYRLPAGDTGRLAVEVGRDGPPATPAPPYAVVHPGASVPARAWPGARHAQVVDALLAQGWRVAVTGGPHETALTAQVAGGATRTSAPGVVNLGGRTTWRELAHVLAGAEVFVGANTGPAHLAAAVGTPVVSLFAPTVPAERWRPWGVPHELLGDHAIACAGCRARECPLPGHPCLTSVTAADVLDGVRRVLADRDRTAPLLVGHVGGRPQPPAAGGLG